MTPHAPGQLVRYPVLNLRRHGEDLHLYLRALEQVVIDPDVVWVLETRRADNYWCDRGAEVDHPLWWLREIFKLARHIFLRFS